MPWFIGSGGAAQSYVLDIGGFLFQSPVTWYREGGALGLAPGYNRQEQPHFGRPILPGCLQCHASGIQHAINTQNRYSTPPFLEGGVSCERCHGPGSAHVQAMKSGGHDGGSQIVNPAKLDAKLRDSVCSQCHLSGEARVPRAGKNIQAFTAGQLFSNYVAVFVRSGSKAGLKVTSHVEDLARSACKNAAGDRLWCGSCHDPHAAPVASERVSWYRAKCLACHEPSSCDESVARRAGPGDDCTSCHMPRSPVMDADHVVFTDHSIPRLPGSRLAIRKTSPSAADASLISFDGAPVDARDLGIAYAMLGQRSRALDLLRRSVKPDDTDAEGLLYLAELYNHNSDRERAVPLYEQAIRMDSRQLTGSVSLGAIRMEQGRYEEAIRLWTDALNKNPALVLVRFNLARALVRVGRRAEAGQVLKDALDFNPEFEAARKALDHMGVPR